MFALLSVWDTGNATHAACLLLVIDLLQAMGFSCETPILTFKGGIDIDPGADINSGQEVPSFCQGFKRESNPECHTCPMTYRTLTLNKVHNLEERSTRLSAIRDYVGNIRLLCRPPVPHNLPYGRAYLCYYATLQIVRQTTRRITLPLGMQTTQSIVSHHSHFFFF